MSITQSVITRKKPLRKRIKISNILFYLALILVSALVLFPVFFVASSSFMGADEIYTIYSMITVDLPEGMEAESMTSQIHLLPQEPTLEGYERVLLEEPSFLRRFWISIFLAGVAVIGQVVLSCFSAYGFAKFQFPLRKTLMFLVIVLMMMPVQVMLVPNYLLLDEMGLIGTYWSIILPAVFSMFGVFLMTQVFSSVPDEIIQAARIDGANHLQVLLRIVVPYAKAGVASLIVLSFIDNWNLVEQPLTFLKDATMWPMSVFLGRINLMQLDAAFVCGILAMLPTVLLFLHFKDAMISGIENLTLK